MMIYIIPVWEISLNESDLISDLSTDNALCRIPMRDRVSPPNELNLKTSLSWQDTSMKINEMAGKIRL